MKDLSTSGVAPTWRYRLGGVIIESDLPLCAAPPDDSVSDACVIRLRLASASLFPPRHAWFHVRTLADGRPWLSVAREELSYLLHVHDHAYFRVDPGAATVECSAVGPHAGSSLEALFLDQIFPLALHALGRFSFHGSAVARNGQEVIAFLGDSGAGKSTLAASLVRAPSFTFFTDDCLAVACTESGTFAHPGYPSARLWTKSATALFADRGPLPVVSPRTDKRRVDLQAHHRPLPLTHIYLLEASTDAPEITRLRAYEAFTALLKHLHRLDVEDRRLLAEELAMLERVVTDVSIARLSYRRDFSELPALEELLRRA